MARERERMRDYVNEREERGERINLIKKRYNNGTMPL